VKRVRSEDNIVYTVKQLAGFPHEDHSYADELIVCDGCLLKRRWPEATLFETPDTTKCRVLLCPSCMRKANLKW